MNNQEKSLADRTTQAIRILTNHGIESEERISTHFEYELRDIDRVEAILHEQRDRIAELEAIVERLSMTANGVPVVSGQVLHDEYGSEWKVVVVAAQLRDGEITSLSAWSDIDCLYSTPEAAAKGNNQ